MRMKVTNLNGGSRTLRLQKFTADKDGNKTPVGIVEFVSSDTEIVIDMPSQGGLELTWQPEEQDGVSPKILARDTDAAGEGV